MTWISGLEHFIRRDEPMAAHTWLKLGGPADFFAEPTTAEELATLVRRCREENVPVRVVGGGSKVLVRDEGVRGVVVQLGAAAFGKIDVKGDAVVAGAGAKLGHVISAAVREGLGGLELLVGIPGTIGGALHGNAGSHGTDVGQWAIRATVLRHDGSLDQRSRDQMHFGYRESSLDDLVIIDAELRLERDNPEQLTKRMQKQWIVKKANQPLAHERTGCIFKNPGGMSAGMLIDQAGLKGVQQGGASVSPRHANFLVTQSDAKTADVLKLIDRVRETVLDRTGVELKLDLDVW